MKPKKLPPLSTLRRLFRYDPKTGIIYRLVQTSPTALVGPVLPAKRIVFGKKVYFQISIKRNGRYEKFYYHRIAWKLHTGKEPPETIDHKNGNVWNNRFKNLRKANTETNGYNRGVQSNNKLGVKGVYQREGRKGYFVRVVVNGKPHYAGSFKTLDAASKQYEKLAKKLHGEFYYKAAG